MSESKPKTIGRYSRLFLLILSEINLVMGAVFYLYPSLVIGYWPWAVKELAVKFLGAIFLAITLGCWSALRAKGWQRRKILTLVGGVFFGITAIITAFQLTAQAATMTVLAWTVYFSLAALGLFTIILQHGWYRKPRDQISQDHPWEVAAMFFRVQTLIVGVFGTLMLFLPDLAQQQFWPWKVITPTLQTFAALFLATCLATGWAVSQRDRARIMAILPLDAIFPALALIAVGAHWDVINRESPSSLVTGVWVFLYSFVAAGSTYLFYTEMRRSKRQRL
jgi:hypothetical protein